MSMISFFPWLALEKRLSFGDFDLLPFRRGMLPAGSEADVPDARLQATLDRVLEPFQDFTGRPVNLATILQLREHGPTDDLSDNERESVFAAAAVVAFGGLAAREFFELVRITYCNADNFLLYTQGYLDEPGGSAVAKRHRDGSTLSYYTADAYRVVVPIHVSAQEKVPLDQELILGLLQARGDGEADALEESIFWFNHANTDQPGFSLHAEAVMMMSSFQRLLGRQDESDVARAFRDAFVPRTDRPVSGAPRVAPGRFKNDAMPIREAWIRDFVRVRGESAHGIRGRYPSVWPLREHLLLGAVAFPLLVKLWLRARGYYKLSRADQEGIDTFERYASVDAFDTRSKAQSSDEPMGWGRVRAELADERLEEAFKAAEEETM